MIEELIKAHHKNKVDTTKAKSVFRLVRPVSMDPEIASALCGELLNNHNIRFSATHLKFLGEDLLKRLNAECEYWMILNTKFANGKAELTIIMDNESFGMTLALEN